MPKTFVSELTTTATTDEPTPPAADTPSAPVVRQRPSRDPGARSRGKGRRKNSQANHGARRFNPSSRFRG